LVANEETSYVNTTMQLCHAFADGVKVVDTLHLNIKVDDIVCLPEEFACARGAKKENAKDGYVKYAFPGNVNVILSAINISQEDLIESKPGLQEVQTFSIMSVSIFARRLTRFIISSMRFLISRRKLAGPRCRRAAVVRRCSVATSRCARSTGLP
jgi:hypothetical protein